jgi:hypothetical protein
MPSHCRGLKWIAVLAEPAGTRNSVGMCAATARRSSAQSVACVKDSGARLSWALGDVLRRRCVTHGGPGDRENCDAGGPCSEPHTRSAACLSLITTVRLGRSARRGAADLRPIAR